MIMSPWIFPHGWFEGYLSAWLKIVARSESALFLQLSLPERERLCAFGETAIWLTSLFQAGRVIWHSKKWTQENKGGPVSIWPEELAGTAHQPLSHGRRRFSPNVSPRRHSEDLRGYQPVAGCAAVFPRWRRAIYICSLSYYWSL